MLTVTLKPDLAEQVTRLAGSSNQASIDAFIDQALRKHLKPKSSLTRLALETSPESKIRAEKAAFEKQHAALLAHYANQYVAFHNGQVIDHDSDLRTLHLRVFKQLGHTTVLLKKVTTEPERELVFRSPRFERGST